MGREADNGKRRKVTFSPDEEIREFGQEEVVTSNQQRVSVNELFKKTADTFTDAFASINNVPPPTSDTAHQFLTELTEIKIKLTNVCDNYEEIIPSFEAHLLKMGNSNGSDLLRSALNSAVSNHKKAKAMLPKIQDKIERTESLLESSASGKKRSREEDGCVERNTQKNSISNYRAGLFANQSAIKTSYDENDVCVSVGGQIYIRRFV